MDVELVTIGTELLLGFTTDTNAAELAQTLAAAGVRVVRRTTVGDDDAAIRLAVEDALARTGTVITTGGLGPTSDDRTTRAVAELLGRRLITDEGILASLERRFHRMGRWPMPHANRSQAEIPEGAEVLDNHWGTAPGLWIEAGRRLVVLLPGVPREMRAIVRASVMPRLAARHPRHDTVIQSVALRTAGVAEATLAERLGPLEHSLAPLTLAYLPSPLGVDLRLTSWDASPETAAARLAEAADRLATALGDDCYGRDDDDLAEIVLARLRQHGRTLAVAESCTGGLVGGRLTAVPGASEVFRGGVVAYDNAVKAGQLGVSESLLAAHGAVSEEVARAMADGVHRALGTWAAIAVTGLAGPSGGSSEKPVGTVCLAVRAGERTAARRRVFPGDREEIRQRGAQAGLDLLRRLL